MEVEIQAIMWSFFFILIIVMIPIYYELEAIVRELKRIRKD